MESEKKTQRRTADRQMGRSRKSGSVWPGQCRPAFTSRVMALSTGRECWYCEYANFHLKERVDLDVHCWPRVQIEGQLCRTPRKRGHYNED